MAVLLHTAVWLGSSLLSLALLLFRVRLPGPLAPVGTEANAIVDVRQFVCVPIHIEDGLGPCPGGLTERQSFCAFHYKVCNCLIQRLEIVGLTQKSVVPRNFWNGPG